MAFSNKISEKINNKRNLFAVIYKLAVDFLVILVAATFLFLMAEGLIFNIASKNIGFIKIVFMFSLDILLIYVLGNFLGVNLEIKNKKKLLSTIALFLSLLIFSSLIRINIFLAISLWTAVVLTGYKIFGVFFGEDTNQAN